MLSRDVDYAFSIAVQAHHGQVDKAGADYFKHPVRVAERLSADEEKVVGLLHDVLEDTDVAPEFIKNEFGDETFEALDAVTHRKDEPWDDYLERVKKNPIATKVKISDLIDNSNLGRLKVVTLKDVDRQGKYNRALRFLMED